MSQATWEVTRFNAENNFEAVRVQAEMVRQVAMKAASTLTGASHIAAVKAAEKAFFVALQVAAEGSGGVFGSAGYRNQVERG